MTELIRKDIDKLKELVYAAPKNIVILSHTNPDGDAIGSSLAWGTFLESKGHKVTTMVPNRPPSFLDWIKGMKRIVSFKDSNHAASVKTIMEADVVFCMDFNQISRLEALGEAVAQNKTARFVLIDHHLNPPEGYDLQFSYPGISSTSFLVYKIIELLEGTDALTLDMCESLYVGMMTDTGNFSFSFLTSDLYRAVAVMVDKGLNIPQIHSNVYNSFTIERVKLLGYTLNKMETLRVGGVGIAYMSLTEEEMRRFKFQQGDSEGFVNYPLTVRVLDMSAIFIETHRFIRVSLRSRGDVDVSRFANIYFEGGGHKNASGGKSFKPMAETVEYFRQSVAEFFGPGGEGHGTKEA